MAGKKQFENGTFLYVFKRTGVLAKPLYLTFESEKEGDAYAKKLEALLDRGIVPSEVQQDVTLETLGQLIRAYEAAAHPSAKDLGELRSIYKSRASTSLRLISTGWTDDWIAEMKRVDKLAPATIRARVGALARCTDWGMRKGHLIMPDHPFRSLPEGYAQYSKDDVAHAGVKREDVERDRRLERGEYEKILEVIKEGVLARKQRPLQIEYQAAHYTLFILAVESAMRLREMYTLSLAQVDLKRRTIFLDKTKNGDKRQVPLSTVAVALLEDYLKSRVVPKEHPEDVLFPWWNGDLALKNLVSLSDYLSKRFIGIFKQAGAEDLKFHDLRHEAVSRLFERTTLSESQIMKISGHKSHRMMMRYANLRGSDLAKALW